MRGVKVETGALFSYLSPEERVPKDHPLLAIRVIVDRSLAELDGHFHQIYSDLGRPSIPPEHLLRALLLQVFYSERSERQLIEQLDYNLLFHWFVGLGMDDPIWVPTVFTKNRDRLLDNGDRATLFSDGLGASKASGIAVRGAFLCGWHLAGGLGFTKILSAQRSRRSAGRRLGFPWAEGKQ